MNIFFQLIVSLCFLLCFAPSSGADDLSDLFKQVEKLGIGRQGYVLGAVLDKDRRAMAAANPIPSTASGTYKFRDRGVNLVVDRESHRVIVIYEHFEAVSRKAVRELTGALFLDFDEPTVMAHDSLVYWAYDRHGKVTTQKYDMAREGEQKLEILATVKLNSEIPIVKKQEESSPGTAYYIISSNPLLKHFTN
ncbi:MAG: hypothetical protein GY737_25545 [Desulfobacteraceae bacterium]|nr:hypothetical protein [Desulfobacteraceae bacterium]